MHQSKGLKVAITHIHQNNAEQPSYINNPNASLEQFILPIQAVRDLFVPKPGGTSSHFALVQMLLGVIVLLDFGLLTTALKRNRSIDCSKTRLVYVDLGVNWANTLRLYKDLGIMIHVQMQRTGKCMPTTSSSS